MPTVVSGPFCFRVRVGAGIDAIGIRCFTNQLSQTQHTIELKVRAPPPKDRCPFFLVMFLTLAPTGTDPATGILSGLRTTVGSVLG